MTITIKAEELLSLAKKAIATGNTELLSLLVRPHVELGNTQLSLVRVKEETMQNYKDWFSTSVLSSAIRDFLVDVDDLTDYNYQAFSKDYLTEKLESQLLSTKSKIQAFIAPLSGQPDANLQEEYKGLTSVIARTKLESLFMQHKDKKKLKDTLSLIFQEQQKLNNLATQAISAYEATKNQDKKATTDLWVSFITKDDTHQIFPKEWKDNPEAAAERILKFTPVSLQNLEEYCLLKLAMETYYDISNQENNYLNNELLHRYLTNIKTILDSGGIDVYKKSLNGFVPYTKAREEQINSCKLITVDRTSPGSTVFIPTSTVYVDHAVVALIRQHIARLGEQGTVAISTSEEQKAFKAINALGIILNRGSEDRRGGVTMLLNSIFNNAEEQSKLRLSLEAAAQASLVYNQTNDFSLMVSMLNRMAGVIYGLDEQQNSQWQGGFFGTIITYAEVSEALKFRQTLNPQDSSPKKKYDYDRIFESPPSSPESSPTKKGKRPVKESTPLLQKEDDRIDNVRKRLTYGEEGEAGSSSFNRKKEEPKNKKLEPRKPPEQDSCVIS